MRSLRTRLTWCFLLLIGGVGLAYGVYISTIYADRLTEEVHKRGETIARHLAEISADAVIAEDRITLYSLIRSVQKTEKDIVYIFFVDKSGDHILADSFKGRFPPHLLSVNPVQPGKTSTRHELRINDLPVYDIGTEVLAERAGFVHVGLNTYPIEETVRNLTSQALGALLFFILAAIIAAGPMAGSITRPIIRLTAAVQQVADGRAKKVAISGKDEISQLATAYNTMIDDLAATQGALKAQLAFREALLNDLPEAVFYKDPNGNILGCSRVFAEFFGSTPEEMVGKTCHMLFYDAEMHLAKDAELQHHRGVITYESLVRHHDGSPRNIIFSKTQFKDAAGASIIIGVMQDITREREVERLKSEFVSAVAHEFQTPLATVLGFAELILNQSITSDDRSEGLRQIMEKAERLSHLVDELLDLSRLETGRKFSLFAEACSLHNIITGVVDDFRHSDHNHTFHIDLPDDPLPIVADATRLSQVIENLLSNAVKYSPRKSAIVISAAALGQEYIIRVKDQGRGMSRDQAAQAFDKFYRADTSDTAPSGTGLGLYLAESIITMHGGDITIDSELGAGTCVSVSLPMSSPPAGAATQGYPSDQTFKDAPVSTTAPTIQALPEKRENP